MRAGSRALISGFTTSALIAGAWLAAPTPAAAGASSTAPVVINEVYGGGGNTGATYKQDFVELYNKSASAVNLAGWSVQYASATGTSWATTAVTGTLPAGAHYIVRESQGTGGTTDVPADVTGTIAMSGTAGKVALVNSTAALSCGADCDGNAAVVDFVGFGTTANDFAGTGPTPAPSNTNSVSRNASHDNTANNAADFTAGAPSPVACGAACTTVTAAAQQRRPSPRSRDPAPRRRWSATPSRPEASSQPPTRPVASRATTSRPRAPADRWTRPPTRPRTASSSSSPPAAFPAAVQVGKYLQVTGAVSEFFGETESPWPPPTSSISAPRLRR